MGRIAISATPIDCNLDRARFTRRRKEAYEALHPETRQHVAGGHAKHGSATDNLSFAAETATATGKDARTVRRDAERGEKITDGAGVTAERLKPPAFSRMSRLLTLFHNKYMAYALEPNQPRLSVKLVSKWTIYSPLAARINTHSCFVAFSVAMKEDMSSL